MNNIKLTYLKTPINKYTFKSKKIKSWVESHCMDKNVLNLFAGNIRLNNCVEVRNDMDTTFNPDYSMDALEFVKTWTNKPFDVIILDPPYSYRKSMEFYKGHKASKFNQLKDYLYNILSLNGIIITFGYHSVSMGTKRKFKQKEILIMSHGGAIHDTIAVVEQKFNEVDLL